jgi:ATP-dependent DNA ligase
MYALAVEKLPQGQEWLYEVKFDGNAANELASMGF